MHLGRLFLQQKQFWLPATFRRLREVLTQAQQPVSCTWHPERSSVAVQIEPNRTKQILTQRGSQTGTLRFDNGAWPGRSAVGLGIRALSPGVFADMPGITELNLGFNDLSVIDARAFQGLGNLTLLYLFFNPRLRWIDPLAFVDLPALQYLHLAGCQLSGLTHHHFAAQAHLTTLMLRCVSSWKTAVQCPGLSVAVHSASSAL